MRIRPSSKNTKTGKVRVHVFYKLQLTFISTHLDTSTFKPLSQQRLPKSISLSKMAPNGDRPASNEAGMSWTRLHNSSHKTYAHSPPLFQLTKTDLVLTLHAVSGYNVFVLALFLALVLTSTTPGNAPRRSNGTPEASSSRATGSSTDGSSSVSIYLMQATQEALTIQTQADIMFPTHPDPTLPEKDRKRWKKLFFGR